MRQPPKCDADTGVCALPEIPAAEKTPVSSSQTGTKANTDTEIVYVGDPLCSWCWAVSPVVRALQGWCDARHLRFTIVAGGLRPGGGDAWNADFKAFLRHHWEEIAQVSGQPFSFRIFEREHFDYDSLPPCRAVVAARHLMAERHDNGASLCRFFAALQRRFYVDNEDPGTLAFYQTPCAENGLDFAAFAEIFHAPTSEEATVADFRLARAWEITGFPAFALIREGQPFLLASGYTDLPALEAQITRLLGQGRVTENSRSRVSNG